MKQSSQKIKIKSDFVRHCPNCATRIAIPDKFKKPELLALDNHYFLCRKCWKFCKLFLFRESIQIRILSLEERLEDLVIENEIAAAWEHGVR